MVKPIIIDTATGVDPHIYSADFAAILNSVDGVDCVKDYLDNLSASIISANEVRLAPGLFAVQGHYAMIPYGDYVSCAIGNGQTGYKRYDLIVARFTRTAGVDDITINVIQGTPSTGTPTIPTVTAEDLEQGGDLREFKLYLVYIDGLTISSVTAQFSVLPSIGTISTNLTAVEGTLAIGATSITLTDARLTATSNIIPMTSKWGVNPLTITKNVGNVVMTFYAQSEVITVGVEIHG